ncbi:MAG: hypothetical protein M3Y86_05760 [Verrucomicrobiota bacterium]|nr:hypothetical protein [Verrucomicrobiota bacterium]
MSSGENSAEYAAVLVQLGDAHMVQGALSNPRAQLAYERALEIFAAEGEESAETAWLDDKLANVKQSSGDSAGAEADLAKAVEFWRGHPQAGTVAPAVSERYLARREEDLERLIRLNEFQNRKPPPLE